MPDLSISYNTIQKNVALMLGWNRTPSDTPGTWSQTQIDDFKLVLSSGLRKFYAAYEWSFLYPRYTLTTSPTYSTGTITVTSGTVTGSGTVWSLLDATDYWLVVDGKQYEIVARAGDTTMTVSDVTLGAAAGTSYSMTRYKYTLPADFGGFIGPLPYAPNQSVYYRPVELTSDHAIRSLYMTNALTNGSEIVQAAVVPQSFSATVGQRWELHTWPASTSEVQLTGRYRVVPNDLDSVTNVYPLGGAQHANTILYAVLSEAEARLWDSTTTANQARYQECLAMSVRYDKRQSSPETLGTVQFPAGSGISVEGALSQGTTLYSGHESSIL